MIRPLVLSLFVLLVACGGVSTPPPVTASIPTVAEIQHHLDLARAAFQSRGCVGAHCPEGARELVSAGEVAVRYGRSSGETCVALVDIRRFLQAYHSEDSTSQRMAELEPELARICPFFDR